MIKFGEKGKAVVGGRERRICFVNRRGVTPGYCDGDEECSGWPFQGRNGCDGMKA
jgi:hypothetical protein